MPTSKPKSSSKKVKTSSKSKSSKSKDKNRSSKDKSSKNKSKSSSREEKVAKTPVEEVVEEVVEETTAATEVAPKATKKRRVVDRESVFASFDALQKQVEDEIDAVRSASDKTRVSGVKFLRSLNKSLKQLKKDTARAMKQKRKNPNRAKNTSSGFMKPVAISGEMSKFTGWNSDELKSRVDVTKYICGYIRDNNLQNPDDRRQIVPDKKLQALLKLDKKSLKEEPLTYYSLQKKIQPHFVAASK
jgi:upstream activation factor subunit UAF30